MSRTFQDQNFLVWEAYPSGSRFGFSERPNIIFHCLTDRALRPRYLEFSGDEADAERMIVRATPEDLLNLLESAREVS